jgi:hypothetical protein
MHRTIRISPYVPPARCTVARALWRDGVYSGELLKHAERWGSDLDRAWAENDRLELAMPLAIVRCVPALDVARFARLLVASMCELLPLEVTWPLGDIGILNACLAGAVAPDVDVPALMTDRGLALERAGRRSDGIHRYRILTAAAHVASLGLLRLSHAGARGSADACLVVEHSIGALRDARTVSDLFSARIDVDAFEQTAMARAREMLGGDSERAA